MAVDPAVLDERRARRRERVVERLLAVVERLLEEEDSYLDLKVERIIEEGGMARSTFYSYFDDKADLIVALGESAMRDILDGAQAIWEQPPEASREQIAIAVRKAFDAYLPHTRLMNALLEVSTYDRRVRERFEAGYSEARAKAAKHIREGQRAGFVRAELHADEAGGWFTWMVERGMTQMVQHARTRAEIDRLVDSFTAIFWNALYGNAVAGPPSGPPSGPPGPAG